MPLVVLQRRRRRNAGGCVVYPNDGLVPTAKPGEFLLKGAGGEAIVWIRRWISCWPMRLPKRFQPIAAARPTPRTGNLLFHEMNEDLID